MAVKRFGEVRRGLYQDTVQIDPTTIGNPDAGSVFEGIWTDKRWLKHHDGSIVYTSDTDYKWVQGINGGSVEDVEDGDTIDLVGGTGIEIASSTVGDIRSLTFNSTTASYHWAQGINGGSISDVNNGDIIDLVGGKSMSISSHTSGNVRSLTFDADNFEYLIFNYQAGSTGLQPGSIQIDETASKIYVSTVTSAGKDCLHALSKLLIEGNELNISTREGYTTLQMWDITETLGRFSVHYQAKFSEGDAFAPGHLVKLIIHPFKAFYNYQKNNDYTNSTDLWTTIVEEAGVLSNSGTYEYKWAWSFQYNSVTKSAHFRLSSDNGVTWSEFTKEVKDITDVDPMYYSYPVEVSTGGGGAATVKIILQGKCESNGDLLSVPFADAIIQRVK